MVSPDIHPSTNKTPDDASMVRYAIRCLRPFIPDWIVDTPDVLSVTPEPPPARTQRALDSVYPFAAGRNAR